MLNRAVAMFKRDPQLSVVLFAGVIIAYLSLSPTLMLFYGSFREQAARRARRVLAGPLYQRLQRPADLRTAFQLISVCRRFSAAGDGTGGDPGVDFDSHQRAVQKTLRAHRHRSQYLSAGHAGGFVDGAPEPAHRAR